MLQDRISDHELKAQNIIEAVCEYYSIDSEMINTKSRLREIVFPKHVCSYLIYLKMSEIFGVKDIAEMLGCHYSNIVYANKTVAGLIESDTNYLADVVYLSSLFKKTELKNAPKNEPKEVLNYSLVGIEKLDVNLLFEDQQVNIVNYMKTKF
jgi:hypothetical protein